LPPALLDKLNIGVHASGAGPADVIAIARKAEECGWYGLSNGDSALDSLGMMTALAATTTTLQLRTGVTLLSREPAQTAIAAATIDQLSRGRFRIGLGTGSRERVDGWFGGDYARPVGRLKDFVGAFRAAWDTAPGKPGNYGGPFYAFKNFSFLRPTYSEKVHVALAANGPQMLRLAGRIADGAMFNDLHGGRYLRETAIPELERGEAEAGRAPHSVWRTGAFLVSIASTSEQAMKRARHGVGSYLMLGHNREILTHFGLQSGREKLEAALKAGDEPGFFAAVTDDMINLFSVCGTRDDCLKIITSYADVLDEAVINVPEWRKPGNEAVAAYLETVDALRPG
jgi:alkanesulfonate monooxygenase SsuD/methylene tetrahydromethanopterin reductase-like flavin-dependent oxidoreductase (luciferase family)